MKELAKKAWIFPAILTMGLLAMSARNVIDPDFWWHLRTGQLILHNHAIFHVDLYSFTCFGQPWINHEWLSDVLIYSVYHLSGWGGVIAMFALVTSFTFLLVFGRCDGNSGAALLLTTWAALASVPLWGARPQMFSLLLISTFLLIIDRSNQNPRLLWALPPLLLLWVNLHAGYLAGIGLLAIFIAGEALDSTLGRFQQPTSRSRIRQLGLTLIACVAVVPLNPYGWKMYWYPVATLHSKAMLNHIAEWFSPDFHQAQYLPALLLIVFSVAAIAYAPRLLPSSELLLLLTTIYLGLRSQRNLAIYAVVAAPVLSRLVNDWRRRPAQPLSEHRSDASFAWKRTAFNVVIIVSLTAFAVLRFRQVLRQQSFAETSHFPAAAVTYLQEHPVAGHIFNYYDWGGYLIWELRPDFRVYIDGRADLYGDAFMDQFSADYGCQHDCAEASFHKWQIRAVLLPPAAPLAAFLKLKPGWHEVFADSTAVIMSDNANVQSGESSTTH